MTKENFTNLNIWATTKRIETLVDGIFAIAMTLLVLSIDVPQLPDSVSNAVMQQALLDMLPHFYIYGLSFVLLAIFWRINHQQFYRIKRADTWLLWINVLWLMFVALVPFSASLVVDYGHLQAPEVFFHINMLLIGMFLYFSWYYATSKGFVEGLTPEEVTSTRKINLLLPIVSLIAIGITFITPSWSSLAYATISIVKRIIDRI